MPSSTLSDDENEAQRLARNDYARRYYYANKERTLANVREYARTHAVEISAKAKLYRQKHRDKLNARSAKWYAANREIALTKQHIYSARIRKERAAAKTPKPPRFTKDQLEDLCLVQRISLTVLAKRFNVCLSTLSRWCKKYKIKTLGSALRRGCPNPSAKRKRTPAEIERLQRARIGKRPPNYGKGKLRFNCEVCGADVLAAPYRKKRTCSQSCAYQLSHIFRGEQHWNYNPDAAYLQRTRYWAECREWRNAVLLRDNNVCQKCKQQGGKLTVHHIKSFSKYPQDRFIVSNGITLCKTCHWNLHRTLGHRTSTHLRFTSWLEGT